MFCETIHSSFPANFLIRTRFWVITNLHYLLICFVWYEGFVKLCSKLCAFVNTIIFSISCVNFIVYFRD